jgi:hypothetical protein
MLSSKRPSDNVLSHWYMLVDNFQFSTDEFYNEIEQELSSRLTPGLTASRVDFHEGGILTDKRTYLRLARERLTFDICAAPFGKTYFFSLRLAEKPRISLVLIFALLALCGVLFNVLQGHAGQVQTIIGLLVVGFVTFWIFRPKNPDQSIGQEHSKPARGLVLPDLSSLILDLPIVGHWYERVRRDTYYRYDTRLIYLTLISEIVKKKVEEITSSKGVKFIKSYEYSPILGELYKSAPKTSSADGGQTTSKQ